MKHIIAFLCGFVLVNVFYQFTLGWWIGLTYLITISLLSWAVYIVFFSKDKGDKDE